MPVIIFGSCLHVFRRISRAEPSGWFDSTLFSPMYSTYVYSRFLVYSSSFSSRFSPLIPLPTYQNPSSLAWVYIYTVPENRLPGSDTARSSLSRVRLESVAYSRYTVSQAIRQRFRGRNTCQPWPRRSRDIIQQHLSTDLQTILLHSPRGGEGCGGGRLIYCPLLGMSYLGGRRGPGKPYQLHMRTLSGNTHEHLSVRGRRDLVCI